MRRASTQLSCAHVFHTRCLRRWVRRGGPVTCPLCRARCIDAAALAGPSAWDRLHAVTRTLPPPPGAFFPSYMTALLERPEVVAVVGHDLAPLLADVAGVSFTREAFFWRVRGLGL